MLTTSSQQTHRMFLILIFFMGTLRAYPMKSIMIIWFASFDDTLVGHSTNFFTSLARSALSGFRGKPSFTRKNDVEVSSYRKSVLIFVTSNSTIINVSHERNTFFLEINF